MRLATMLRDVLRSLFKRPATEPFPNPEPNEPQRLRGRLYWDPAKCTGCCLCVKDCPANAIEVLTIDKKNKLFVMRYDLGRCTYCAQCVQNCRFECLSMSNKEWALAATSKEPFTVYYGDEADIEKVLAGLAGTETEAE